MLSLSFGLVYIIWWTISTQFIIFELTCLQNVFNNMLDRSSRVNDLFHDSTSILNSTNLYERFSFLSDLIFLIKVCTFAYTDPF